MTNNYTLAERDKLLNKIEKEIKEKKQILLEINNNYTKNLYDDYDKDNSIKNEYNDYSNIELNIYETQLEKLRNLLDYNDKFILENKDDQYNLKEIHNDQKDIYSEIKKIEKKLNKIS